MWWPRNQTTDIESVWWLRRVIRSQITKAYGERVIRPQIAKAYGDCVQGKMEEVDEKKKMIDVDEHEVRRSLALRIVGAVLDHLALEHRELGLDIVLIIDERLDERRVR